jgi:glucose/arabinose dehydrogenase
MSLASSAIALAIFVGLAGERGVAQQPPAGGQPGVAPQGDGQGRGQARGGGRGGRGGGAPVDTLGAGPWEYPAGRGGGRIRVSVVTKGLDTPWGLAFVPDGSILVTERVGRLRVIRNGVLDPTPIGPLPDMLATGLGGMMDISLHPQFAQNRLIYFTYSKPSTDKAQCADAPEGRQRQNCSATTAVARARWDGGSTLTNVQDILVTDAWHGGPGTSKLPGVVGPATGSYGSRLAWDKNGLLYVTSGDRNYEVKAQDPNSHIGKILRVRDDGTVPPDNPFVNRTGYKPEIYTLGHRNPLGMEFHPVTGELWSTEQGPQGGDELNKIEAGKNYGWPVVSLGRNYDGTIVGKGFSAPGMEDPVVFWVPAIAISGLGFYNGDKFPQWRGNAFVGGMRNNTGQHIQRVQFNDKGLPTGRELMFGDLRQRIREVKQGPDGLLYFITDHAAGAMLKVEPVAAQ